MKENIIAFDGRELYYGNTGISRYLLNLISYISLNKDIDEIFIFSNKKIKKYDEINETIKIIISTTKNNFLYEQVILPKLLKKYNITTFISPFYKCPYLNKTTKKIITIHDIGFLTFPSEYYCRSSFYRFFAKLYFMIFLKKADKIISVSNYTKQCLIDNFNIEQEKISVEYNTVNQIYNDTVSMQNFIETRKIKEKYGLYILSVSNFKPHKNITNLIKAFSMIKNNISHNLLLVGPDNEWKNKIIKLIKELNLENRIILSNIENAKELSLIYSLASIYIQPSLHEGFGLPVVEAQACGTPVLSSNQTSLPEILKDSAIYINPFSILDMSKKMLTVLNNEQLKQDLIQKGYTNSERFRINSKKNNIID